MAFGRSNYGRRQRLDLRQLRYFVVLAEQQHFGRAASILHIAQPALTRQIRLLEEELRVTLFERHPRGATPTDAASILLERASFILRYAEQLKQDIIATQRVAVGPVALGISPGLAHVMAAPLAQVVRERLPGVHLQVIEGFADHLRTQLLEGTLDVAILNGPRDLPNLVTTSLLRERICLIGLAEHPKLQRRRVTVTDLAGLPLILTGVAKSGVRLQLEAAAAKANTTLEAVIEVQSIDIAKQLMLQQRDACTVHFAAPIKADIDAGVFRAIPIDGLELSRFLARVTGRPPSRATVVLTDTVNEVVRSFVRSGHWPNAVLDEGSASKASR